MATNLDIIRGALQQLGVLTEVEQPSAEQAADGLGVLNELLEDWSAEGIEIGQYPQTDLAEEYPGPSNTEGTVKSMLAIYLSAHYERPVPPATAARASRGFERLIRDSVRGELAPADLNRKLPPSEGGGDFGNILTGE